MAGVEKTVQDRQNTIQEAVRPYLPIPSSFSFWNPTKMNYHLSKSTRILTASEIENNFILGEYPRSDMHILRAVHSFGYCTKASISKLIEYYSVNTPALCIPPLREEDVWERLIYLSQRGVLRRYVYYPNDIFRAGDKIDKPRSIFCVSGIGASMYKTILLDNLIVYDNRMAFYNEEDVFRRAQNSILVAAFLKSPYLTGVRFQVNQSTERRRAQLMCVLKMALNDKAENECRLICESLTHRTNNAVVAEETRKRWIFDRVNEIAAAFRTIRQKTATYILFCVEDAQGVLLLRDCIEKIDQDLFRYCIITTGTILERYNVLAKPENLSKCFLEFDVNKKLAFVGATGYYFLEWGSDGKDI